MNTEIIEHKNTSTMMMDSEAIESFKDMAQLMCKSTVSLPEHFKNKPADCLAVVMQSAQWRMNPFVVAQKTHVINGTLGYEAQLVNAVVSSSTAIDGRFKYEYQGERADWKPKFTKESRNGKDYWKTQFSEKAAVRVGAVLAGEEDITWGEWVYPCDQTIFNSPLWRTNPKQQAGYLAVKFWTRFYTPDVLLGVYTPDELEEAQIKDITPPKEQQEQKTGGAMERLQNASKKRKNKPKKSKQGDSKGESEKVEPEAAEEPEMDESKVIFGEFMQSMDECRNMDDLNQQATAIESNGRFNEHQLNSLRKIYTENKNRIEGYE